MRGENQSGAKPFDRSELIRGLGLWSPTAIVIGDTIGTGIFLVSSDMARTAGSAMLVFAAWIFGGLIVLFGAFCYAELGAAFPKAGGPYVYLSRGLGAVWGFLFGWMSSFLERPVAMATLAAGFMRFTGFLFPVVATPLFTQHVGSYEFTFYGGTAAGGAGGRGCDRDQLFECDDGRSDPSSADFAEDELRSC